MRCRALTLGILASTLFAAPAAFGQGQANDLALNRLSYFNRDPGGPGSQTTFAGGCGTASADWAQCAPDNQMFLNLTNQLGVALAPPLLAPADTHGYNGLYFGYEGTVTSINAEADYWHRGTEGTSDGRIGGQGTAAVRDRVPNALYVSHFHVRKAFPLGFELGLHTSWLHDSSMVLLGLDIRWALFEGFRNGVTGWIPDLAVRGAVNTLVGNPQLYLTMVSVDAVLSKRLTLAGQVQITPYLGAQGLMILGDSTVIDGTPLRSSYHECPTRTAVFSTNADGSRRSDLICSDAPTNLPPMGVNDSRNEMVFAQTRVIRTRGFAGLRLRYSFLTITGEFSYDVIDPQWLSGDPNRNGNVGRPDDNNGGAATPVTLDNYRQWQVSFGAGLTF